MALHILALDDDSSFLTFLRLSFGGRYQLSEAQTIQEAEKILQAGDIDLLLLDLSLGSEDGLALLKKLKNSFETLDVVIVTGHKDPKKMVEAIRLGAADYLVKPFDIEEIQAVIEKLAPYRAMREKHAALLSQMNAQMTKHTILGQSSALQEVMAKARCVQGHMANVLIEGESGTGKELLARFIHGLESDAHRPFVAVNCAAIPETLLESELFGHEKGAFTGAHQRKLGKFELAHGGDIFLDEISTLKWDLQAKILRALQEKEVLRIGGNHPVATDFRIIAATNESLEGLVDQGKFRRDLFHRLRVIPLSMPPLSSRKEDIPLLTAHFIHKYSKNPAWHFSGPALKALQDYYWPGNIRELENLVQSLVILIPGPIVQASDLPEWVFRKQGHAPGSTAAQPSMQSSFSALLNLPQSREELRPLKEYVSDLEKAYVGKALELTKGDKSKTATLLDISRTRLYERLKNWGMMQ